MSREWKCWLSVCLALLFQANKALAIGCASSAAQEQPVLVLQEVRSDIQGVDSSQLEQGLRARLDGLGKFRVLYPDQFEHARRSGMVDLCTPAFAAQVLIQMQTSDPGSKFGFGGIVTRVEFFATVQVALIPEAVTLSRFSLQEKADAVLSGQPVEAAFGRLFESIAARFESNRVGWIRQRLPDYQPPPDEVPAVAGAGDVVVQNARSNAQTIDEVYSSRRDECSRGFRGSRCRDRIRAELCDGRWSHDPPNGESQCRID